MTGPESAGRPGGNRIFLGGAVALIAAVAVLVFLFGIVRPPALAKYSPDGARPSGGIAFVHRGDQGCGELRVVHPDGSSLRGACESDIGDVVGWTSAGVQVQGWAGTGPTLALYDPATAELISVARSDGGLQAVAGEGVTVRRGRDGTMTVSAETTGKVLWTAHADGRYAVKSGSRSPDGAWFALVDSAGRLLLVPADGSAAPVVWSADAPDNIWPGPVWEGARAGTSGVKSG